VITFVGKRYKRGATHGGQHGQVAGIAAAEAVAIKPNHLIQWAVIECFGVGGGFQSLSRECVPSPPLALLDHASAERLWQGKPLRGSSPLRPYARILSLYRGNAGLWDSRHLSEDFEQQYQIFFKAATGLRQ
jgi:hypothetical protein